MHNDGRSIGSSTHSSGFQQSIKSSQNENEKCPYVKVKTDKSLQKDVESDVNEKYQTNDNQNNFNNNLNLNNKINNNNDNCKKDFNQNKNEIFFFKDGNKIIYNHKDDNKIIYDQYNFGIIENNNSTLINENRKIKSKIEENKKVDSVNNQTSQNFEDPKKMVNEYDKNHENIKLIKFNEGDLLTL